MFPNLIVVHPSVPAKNLAELIKLARDKPGTVTYGSSGIGGAGHLAGELLAMMAHVQLVHVPYKGGGPAMADLVGGQVAFSFASMPSALQFVQAGRLRAIAVSGAQRSALFPSVPTVAEAALPGFASEDWQGVLAPARTPQDTIMKLNGEIARILAIPEIKARLAAAGFDARTSTPRWFAEFIQAETLKWAKLLKQSGIKAE